VHHDCVIDDFVNLNPGVTLAGNVHVGEGSFIGVGATVIENLVIGEGSIVGAGAVVIKDLPAHVTAVGVPARIVKWHPVTAQ
jgi:acetyltransferase-like isoleucine patch superfamily enzyme